MKSFIVLSITALVGVYATDASTVVCSGCPPVSSTPDVVTRSPVPTTPCTAPTLMIVTQSGGASPTGGMGGNGGNGGSGGNGGNGGNPPASGATGAPSGSVPVTAGANGKVVGSLGGVVALAAAVALF